MTAMMYVSRDKYVHERNIPGSKKFHVERRSYDLSAVRHS